MSSTILSSLGENILIRNALGIITDNWVVLRPYQSQAQILVSIESISAIKFRKSSNLNALASGIGCLLMAIACLRSKESGSTWALAFALVGIVLSLTAQVNRKASVILITDPEQIQTAVAPLPEVATLVTVIQSTRRGNRWGDRPIFEFLYWVRWYLALLV